MDKDMMLKKLIEGLHLVPDSAGDDPGKEDPMQDAKGLKITEIKALGKPNRGDSGLFGADEEEEAPEMEEAAESPKEELLEKLLGEDGEDCGDEDRLMMMKKKKGM